MSHPDVRYTVLKATMAGIIPHALWCGLCGLDQSFSEKGRPRVIWHHPDYGRPLYLVPLCYPCHAMVHQDPVRWNTPGIDFSKVEPPKRHKVQRYIPPDVWIHKDHPAMPLPVRNSAPILRTGWVESLDGVAMFRWPWLQSRRSYCIHADTGSAERYRSLFGGGSMPLSQRLQRLTQGTI